MRLHAASLLLSCSAKNLITSVITCIKKTRTCKSQKYTTIKYNFIQRLTQLTPEDAFIVCIRICFSRLIFP